MVSKSEWRGRHNSTGGIMDSLEALLGQVIDQLAANSSFSSCVGGSGANVLTQLFHRLRLFNRAIPEILMQRFLDGR